MAMTATKYIISETSSFAAKLIHHEERAKSSPDNLPNFNNPLVYKIEGVNDNFNFKEAIIQPDRMDLVEAIRKEIEYHEADNHWDLVRRRDIYGKKTIISIW